MSNRVLHHLKHLNHETHVYHSRHMNQDGRPLFTNRLVHETSPYLLQHAHNPVNWFPWGGEAFELSRTLNRPLFISIGYATCHWCHVMEEESFEDLEIADYINNHFVAVKVDREERPDIDSIYMGAVQLINGNGGWPLNVFLTAHKKPFYGGTYFPARDGDRGPSTGFLTILKKIHEAYISRRDAIEQTSDELTAAIQKLLDPPGGNDVPGPHFLNHTVNVFKSLFDHEHGGIKGVPKFPSSFPVRLLMKHHQKSENTQCLDMALKTLEQMARGGMYDQIGGGFHRYATDSAWLIPHFEKMLYDNALLTVAYLEAYQLTGQPFLRSVSEGILNYILREMRSSDGLFYAATDADSLTESGEKDEGFFFTWAPEDIELILGSDDAALARTHFSMNGGPHFEGRYIPHITQDERITAESFGLDMEIFHHKISHIAHILFQERLKRTPPITDTKVITAWNSLMISALARAGFVFGRTDFSEAAGHAARTLWEKVYIENRVYRTYQKGKPRHRGCLEDHAFLVQAFIDLHEHSENSIDASWLSMAIELDDVLSTYFEDKENGGFFMTASDHEPLIAREKPGLDHATPSGNSVHALNLLRLYSLTGNAAYKKRAEKTFSAFSKQIEQHPHGFGDMLLALDYYYGMAK